MDKRTETREISDAEREVVEKYGDVFLTCGEPVVYDFPLGLRRVTFKEMADEWDEERRGWTGT